MKKRQIAANVQVTIASLGFRFERFAKLYALFFFFGPSGLSLWKVKSKAPYNNLLHRRGGSLLPALKMGL